MFVKPDIQEIRLQEEDRLILCSDGIWSVIDDEEFAVLAEKDQSADRLTRSLVDLALTRETDDNLSAIVINISHLPQPSSMLPASKFTDRLTTFRQKIVQNLPGLKKIDLGPLKK